MASYGEQYIVRAGRHTVRAYKEITSQPKSSKSRRASLRLFRGHLQLAEALESRRAPARLAEASLEPFRPPGEEKGKARSVGIPALRRISISDIAKTNGVPRDTVYKYLAKDSPSSSQTHFRPQFIPYSPNNQKCNQRCRKKARTSSTQHARM